MPFASGGGIGTAQSSASGTTVAITTTATVSVGELIVVFCAWDNTDTADTASAAMNGRLKCTDSAGNRYICGDSYVNGQSAAAAGAHVAIFYVVATVQLASGGTITVTSDTARVSKAISAHKFTITTNFVAQTSARRRAATDAADPAALTVNGWIEGGEKLILHALAAEGPQTDAYTWDSDYTQITGDGTNTGTAASDMHVRGGYRIAVMADGGSDSIDVTSTTADRDYAQIAVVLREWTLLDFPTTPILDDMNRANETPLSQGGLWDSGAVSNFNLTSNQGASSVSTTARRRRGTTYNGDVEWYFTIATKPALAGDQVECINDWTSGTGSSWDGNIFAWLQDGSLAYWVEVVNDSITAFVWQMVGTAPAMADGDKMGLRRRGDFTEAWVRTGGVWTCLAVGTFISLNKGKPGIGCRGTTCRLDDVGGGELPLPVLRYVDAAPF